MLCKVSQQQIRHVGKLKASKINLEIQWIALVNGIKYVIFTEDRNTCSKKMNCFRRLKKKVIQNYLCAFRYSVRNLKTIRTG